MFRNFGLAPKSISMIPNTEGGINFYVLWTGSQVAYPLTPPLWENEPIPRSYYPGSDQGFAENDLDFINRNVEEFMRRFQVPAFTLGIVVEEELKFAAAYGKSDLKNNVPVGVDQIFQPGSIGKPFMSALVFRLIELGILPTITSQVFGPGAILGET